MIDVQNEREKRNNIGDQMDEILEMEPLYSWYISFNVSIKVLLIKVYIKLLFTIDKSLFFLAIVI